MARFGSILLTLIFLGAVAAVMGLRWYTQETTAPGPLAAEKLVVIEPGHSTKAISAELYEEGVIRSPLAFLVDARLQNMKAGMKAGEYQLLPGMSIDSIIALLQSGKTYQHKLTIPEGLTVAEIAGILKNEPALAGDIAALPPEGSLLPETYKFTRGTPRTVFLARMQEAMQQELNGLWEKRAADLPLSREEAVVLASIVEKETALPAERPRVAGVFLNRLHKGIPLQSDPTVIYALTHGQARLERSLTHDDLKTPSAYNTYIATGLPPTAIANPGKASIAAVLNPEKNNYLYFVANGSGGHSFAATLKEHNNNVAHWRLLRKNAN